MNTRLKSLIPSLPRIFLCLVRDPAGNIEPARLFSALNGQGCSPAQPATDRRRRQGRTGPTACCPILCSTGLGRVI
jgi:hypothetical protein